MVSRCGFAVSGEDTAMIIAVTDSHAALNNALFTGSISLEAH
jgi:hypothetical protein